MRIKVTDEEISKATEKKNQYVSFDDFMAENPKIKNDLYASRMHLLDGVNWMKLDCGLEKSDYKDCDSLYRILMHKEEITAQKPQGNRRAWTIPGSAT